MPIIQIRGEKKTSLTPQGYGNEKELQRLLSAHPGLLMDDSEAEVETVKQEMDLPGTGRIDLLLVDDKGRLTVVEVKLRSNAESRREVIAQVFDYVSALGEHSVLDLDRITGGALDAALRSFPGAEEDEKDFTRRWTACSENLRLGKIRVAVAIDSASENLVRIVRFINDHSDLDVRLVEISKYKDAEGGRFLVPKLLVHGQPESRTPRPRARKAAKKELAEFIRVYDKVARPGLQTRGGNPRYRQMYLKGWPTGLHYEFLDCGENIGLEIHMEHRDLRFLRDVLRPLVDPVLDAIPDAEVRWVRRRSRRLLVVRLPMATPPKSVAKAMNTLIDVTLEPMQAAIDKLDTGDEAVSTRDPRGS